MHELNYKHLLAERNSLEHMINNAKNPNSISVRSLQTRLNHVIEQIDSIDPMDIIQKAVITFRGKPVNGSKSISADFSAKALAGLTEMIATIAASSTNTLNYHGAIPNKNQHNLQITGTAVGSFGFELSLPSAQNDLINGSKNETAYTLSHIQKLLQYGISGTDEQVSELIEVIHPRAISKVRDFLTLMYSQEALFAIQFDNDTTRIETNDQLIGLIDRLSLDNIKESDETFHGKFIGVLPKTRTFEFQDESNSIIKGKISDQVHNPAYINQEYLEKFVTVSFHVTRFGNAKPKYVLTDIDEIS